MNDNDLRAILRDMERVAQAAAQLAQHATPQEPAKPGAASTERVDPLGAVHHYAHEHPWRTLWIATAVGFLVGSMLTRRSRSNPESPRDLGSR